MSQTTTTTVSTSGKPASRLLAVVLGILGILAIVLGVLYLAGALNSIHFLVGKHYGGSHYVRASVSFVAGVVLLILSWAASRSR